MDNGAIAVYVDGQASGTPQAYAQQAQQLVDAAPPSGEHQEWMPLGVFAFTCEVVGDSQEHKEWLEHHHSRSSS